MRKFIIKDKDNRMWEVKTDATSDAVKYAVKFLVEIECNTIPYLEKMLLTYGYEVQSEILQGMSIDFEM